MTQDTDTNKTNLTEFSKKLESFKKLDPQNIKQKPGGTDRRNGNKLEFDYVPWHVVADMLDEGAPNWIHSVKDVRQIGEHMVVIVAITIDGITREGVGTGPAISEMGIKKAEHDALKRAAVKFGVGRELYKKESKQIDRQGSQRGNGAARYNNEFDPNRPPVNPVSMTTTDGMTKNQKDRISAVARTLDIDAEAACRHFLKCGISELSKSAASWFISLIESPDFVRQTPAPKPTDNVVQLPKSEPQVSPAVTGKLLLEAGQVKANTLGWLVTQNVGGKNCEFQVGLVNDSPVCVCGDYKTHVNIQKEAAYQCCHIVAAMLYKAAAGAQTRTAS